jgi:hypothetical protein
MRIFPCLLLAVAASSASASPVNLIINGSFEQSPVATGTWKITDTLPGWTYLSGPGTGFEIRNDVAGSAVDGNNFIELDTNGNTHIGQYLDQLVAGSTYELSYWLSPRPGLGADTNGMLAFWNGVQLDAATSAMQGDWTRYSYAVTAAEGRNLLSFQAIGTSDSYGSGLDNVQLSQVPEPGSLALTLAALAGALALRRRAIGLDRSAPTGA